MPRPHILYILSWTFQSLEEILEGQRENTEEVAPMHRGSVLSDGWFT